VRLGVLILPEHRWSIAAPMWRRVEDLGFDHAWTFDHIAWRELRDEPWFASIPTLTAAALATSTLRVGTLVASPNFRHPVPFARELLTLDDISGGRLTVGLGSGGVGWDATILGQEAWSPRERTDRFTEFVTLLDKVLREPEVSATGRYYEADGARSNPGCVQRPRVPFAIAAIGPRGMRLAAEHAEIWVSNGDRTPNGPTIAPAEGADMIRRQMMALDRACEAAGRDPASLRRLVLLGGQLAAGMGSRAAFQETKGAYHEVGVTDLVVHWPRPSDPFAGDPADLEHLVA
jgi:alkanesulfonate monooxygenase SsuD/methylene tetrahydromethanopterin reductase-like flavin-dependent oxidoreductase (luciferase family)